MNVPQEGHRTMPNRPTPVEAIEEWWAARYAVDRSTHPAVRGDLFAQRLWLMRAQVHATLAAAAPAIAAAAADNWRYWPDEDQGDEDQGATAAEPLILCGNYGPDFPAPGSVCIRPAEIHDDMTHRGHAIAHLAFTPREWPQELPGDWAPVAAMTPTGPDGDQLAEAAQ